MGGVKPALFPLRRLIMVFKSTPGMYIKVNNKFIQRVTGLKGFYFDKDGLFETDKEILIKALTGKFEEVKPIVKIKEEPKEVIKEKVIEVVKEKPIVKHTPKKNVSHKK